MRWAGSFEVGSVLTKHKCGSGVSKLLNMQVKLGENNRSYVSKGAVLVACVFFLAAFYMPLSCFSDATEADTLTAHPMVIAPYAGTSTPQGFSPSQIRAAYNLPASGGAGSTIAIVDAYSTPHIETYFNYFSHQYGLPDSTTGNFFVHNLGTSNTDSGWALETCLDVEWAHAIAPNATILLVEAVSAKDNDLLAAVNYATNQPGVVAVAMSWGENEFRSESNLDSYFSKEGITFFASSGDDGGSNLNWPAVSPNVVGVGGTTLKLNSNGTVFSENAWQNSSGGVSSWVPNLATKLTLASTTVTAKSPM